MVHAGANCPSITAWPHACQMVLDGTMMPNTVASITASDRLQGGLMPSTEGAEMPKESLCASFRRNLKEALAIREWTPTDLARASGIGETSARKIMREGCNVSLELIERVCDGLGCHVSFLLKGETPPKPGHPKMPAQITAINPADGDDHEPQ